MPWKQGALLGSFHPMDSTSEGRKRKVTPTPVPEKGGSRKVARLCGELSCPVCEVTLWPGTVQQHYLQELEKLSSTSPSLAHTKKNRRSSSRTNYSTPGSKGQFQRAHQVLESVKRRHILFHQRAHSSSTLLPCGSTHLTSEPASSRTCPVCDCPLPSDEGVAEVHVTECLRRGRGGEEGGSDSEEEYEEYTWCNVTRVRATSMLSPQARANMFDGTLISKGEGNQDEVDVEDDETATYGPPQFSEKDVELSMQNREDSKIDSIDGEERDPSHVLKMNSRAGEERDPSPVQNREVSKMNSRAGKARDPSPVLKMNIRAGEARDPSPVLKMNSRAGEERGPSPVLKMNSRAGEERGPSPVLKMNSRAGEERGPSPVLNRQDSKMNSRAGEARNPSPVLKMNSRAEEERDPSPVLKMSGRAGEEREPACHNQQQQQQQHCLICMDSYHNPVVSVKCWHVYCQRCWLKALRTKKLCPKCKDITSSSDLRKIFL